MDLPLHETINYKRLTARTGDGEATRAAAVAVAARVERQAGTTDDASGSVLSYSARIFTAVELKLTDLVFFSEDSTSDDNTGRRPIRIDAVRDLDGRVSHWESLL